MKTYKRKHMEKGKSYSHEEEKLRRRERMKRSQRLNRNERNKQEKATPLIAFALVSSIESTRKFGSSNAHQDYKDLLDYFVLPQQALLQSSTETSIFHLT